MDKSLESHELIGELLPLRLCFALLISPYRAKQDVSNTTNRTSTGDDCLACCISILAVANVLNCMGIY